MDSVTFVYLVNSVLLIVHEIDSAYWREWELFRLPGGLDGFLLLHVPIVGLILYGLLEIASRSMIGVILYFVVSLGGFFAFIIHSYFLRKGDERFTSKISRLLLYSIFLVSLVQLYCARAI
jgi:hypothetical protein